MKKFLTIITMFFTCLILGGCTNNVELKTGVKYYMVYINNYGYSYSLDDDYIIFKNDGNIYAGYNNESTSIATYKIDEKNNLLYCYRGYNSSSVNKELYDIFNIYDGFIELLIPSTNSNSETLYCTEEYFNEYFVFLNK